MWNVSSEALNAAQAEEEEADGRSGSQVAQGLPRGLPPVSLYPTSIKGCFAAFTCSLGRVREIGERGSACPFQEECFGVSDRVKRNKA